MAKNGFENDEKHEEKRPKQIILIDERPFQNLLSLCFFTRLYCTTYSTVVPLEDAGSICLVGSFTSCLTRPILPDPLLGASRVKRRPPLLLLLLGLPPWFVARSELMRDEGTKKVVEKKEKALPYPREVGEENASAPPRSWRRR